MLMTITAHSHTGFDDLAKFTRLQQRINNDYVLFIHFEHKSADH